MATIQPNIFNVNSSSGDSVITVGPDGYCVINKLALLDDVTGNKWEIRISNGEIIVEPIELEDKREHKLNKILKND
jgi:methyl coenzyme M reductase subunit D